MNGRYEDPNPLLRKAFRSRGTCLISTLAPCMSFSTAHFWDREDARAELGTIRIRSLCSSPPVR